MENLLMCLYACLSCKYLRLLGLYSLAVGHVYAPLNSTDPSLLQLL